MTTVAINALTTIARIFLSEKSYFLLAIMDRNSFRDPPRIVNTSKRRSRDLKDFLRRFLSFGDLAIAPTASRTFPYLWQLRRSMLQRTGQRLPRAN